MTRAAAIIFVIGFAWLLSSTHAATVQICGTMDYACQVTQESPQ